MENSTIPWTTLQDTSNNDIYEVEKKVFMVFILVVAILAIPPNVLLLYLALRQDPKNWGGKKNSLVRSTRTARRSDLSLLLISQSVSHVLICLASPLDGLFLVIGDSDDVVCVLFLSVKSVLTLFSVLAVSLQGLDKAYRVWNLHDPFLRVRAEAKIAAISVTAVLSTIPLIIELSMTQGRLLQDGCYVHPAVVDATEVIFFFGCSVSLASLIAVIVILRRHSRRVTAGEETSRGRRSTTSRVILTSAPLPSISEQVDVTMVEQGVDTGTDDTELGVLSPDDRAQTTQKQPVQSKTVEGSADGNEDNTIHVSASGNGCETSAKEQTSNPSNNDDIGRQALPPIVVQTTHSLPTNSDGTRTITTESIAEARAAVVDADDTSEVILGMLTSDSDTTTGRAGRTGDRNSGDRSVVRWSLRPSQVNVAQGCPEEGAGSGARGNLSGRANSNKVSSNRSRSISTSSATLQRLRFATVTAAKRGILTMAIFLICYLPLMVTLLVLSLDHPVYETALLLEGLTLPISYVHALLSPVVMIRFDMEWKKQTASVLSYLQCWKSARPR